MASIQDAQVPLLSGFYPDPSICRAGDDFYLVNSSNEYLPALPLHHSTDLVTWTPIGHAITRPEQFPTATPSKGMYAPTIRHHDGVFWIVTTDVNRIEQGQMLIHATEPEGPWSDPVFVAGAWGIDPDIAWDDRGNCFLTWAIPGPDPSIQQARLDAEKGKLLEKPRLLWKGTGMASPEGPHMAKRGDWWYLIIAEGGTANGHCVSVGRSRDISGPFEANPFGPILTHRSSTRPVQNTGHADLAPGPDGDWAMVYLGVRPRGFPPGFHVNGRETFLAKVDWVDDWPQVREDAFSLPVRKEEFVDRFHGPLGPLWVSPSLWPDTFTSLVPGGGLCLESSERAMVATRARHLSWEFEIKIKEGDAAAVVRMDDDNVFRIRAESHAIVVEVQLIGFTHEIGRIPRQEGDLTLRLRSQGNNAGFFAKGGPDVLFAEVVDGENVLLLGSLDGRYLSTEALGSFTGRMIGIQVDRGRAVIDHARYTGTDA